MTGMFASQAPRKKNSVGLGTALKRREKKPLFRLGWNAIGGRRGESSEEGNLKHREAIRREKRRKTLTGE